MQFVSAVASATLATAILVDCDVALAVLSGFAAVQFALLRWRRPNTASDRAAPQPDHSAPPAISARRCDELRAALAQLPADQQRIIQLRIIEGRRMHEVAATTGLSYEAIRAAQYHALTTLAGALKPAVEPPRSAPPT